MVQLIVSELKHHLKSHVHLGSAFLLAVKETTPGLLAPDIISIGDGNTTGIGQSGTSQRVLFWEQVNGSDSPLPAALKPREDLPLSPQGSALWQFLWPRAILEVRLLVLSRYKKAFKAL